MGRASALASPAPPPGAQAVSAKTQASGRQRRCMYRFLIVSPPSYVGRVLCTYHTKRKWSYGGDFRKSVNKLLIFEKIGDLHKTRPAFLVKKPGGGWVL